MTAHRRLIVPLGDAALLVRLGEGIDPSINRRVHALAHSIGQAGLEGVVDVCPAYADLAVYFNPVDTSFERLKSQIESFPIGEGELHGNRVDIPVHYGGADGPDLEDVSRLTGLTEDAVVAAHTAQAYTVYMVGFLPGFPYMGTVPEELVVPRLPAPRTRVPAGSVGLAMRQTGVYPLEAPGGWRIIGRTDLRLFDPERPQPCLLRPGDEVHFSAV